MSTTSHIRGILKSKLSQYESVWNAYQHIKHQYLRLQQSLYYFHDLQSTYKYMDWRRKERLRRSLSAELLFQYHKLEKGLVMPGKPRMFGEDPSRATIRLLDRWRQEGHPQDDPIYLGALETLQGYVAKLEAYALDPQERVLAPIKAYLQAHPARTPQLQTPHPLSYPLPQQTYEALEQLVISRRSVREFAPQLPPDEAITKAAAIGAQAPSACNRQPWRVHVFKDPEQIKALLQHQNGNRGFGHLVPCLAIITADKSGFFDATERNQPYIDGGLFSMSFIYGLAAQDIASCCLNWCVRPATDRKVHQLAAIPEHESIIMYLALGYPLDSTKVPRSPRRAHTEILEFHS